MLDYCTLNKERPPDRFKQNRDICLLKEWLNFCLMTPQYSLNQAHDMNAHLKL